MFLNITEEIVPFLLFPKKLLSTSGFKPYILLSLYWVWEHIKSNSSFLDNTDLFKNDLFNPFSFLTIGKILQLLFILLNKFKLWLFFIKLKFVFCILVCFGFSFIIFLLNEHIVVDFVRCLTFFLIGVFPEALLSFFVVPFKILEVLLLLTPKKSSNHISGLWNLNFLLQLFLESFLLG